MLATWFYYPAALLLLAANCVAWMGTLHRLPGNWIIFANCLLFASLLPVRENEAGLGWFSLTLIVLLAILGESLTYAVKRQRILQPLSAATLAGRSSVLVGAGLGSLTCVVAGMAVPMIGPLLAILGAVGGAAGGAWLGSVVTPRPTITRSEDQVKRKSLLSRILTDDQIEILPRLTVGLLMVLIAMSSSLL